MFCPKCGKENKDESEYCKYCGSSLKKSKKEITPISNSDEDDKRKNYIIIALVVLIAIAGITCVLMVSGVFNQHTNNNVNSNNNQPVSYDAFPISQAPALARTVSDSNYASSITFNGLTLSKAQYLYILTKSIKEISAGNSQGSIAVGSYSYASSPSGRDYSQSITQTQYVDMCNRFSSWMDSKHTVPNYIGVNTAGASDISPTKMAQICCQILVSYGNTGQLPLSVNI